MTKDGYFTKEMEIIVNVTNGELVLERKLRQKYCTSCVGDGQGVKQTEF